MGIAYSLSQPAADGRMLIVDAQGRAVWGSQLTDCTPGQHQITWDGYTAQGARPRNGVYFARLMIGAQVAGSGRIVLID